MEDQFEKLARLRISTINPTERRKILDAMIPVGSYDQLERLLRDITSQTYRAKILDRMLPLGTYEQLARLRTSTIDSTERRKILDAMIPIGSYDQLEKLLRNITSQTYRAKILDRMLLLSGKHRTNQTDETVGKKPTVPSREIRLSEKQFDVFIAHASEDKDFVTPLALSLKQRGLEVWYDDFVLKMGDSLRREIDKGLAQSRYGIVVLSHSFFNKDWPRKELDGLTAKEELGKKVILPVWHNIEKDDVARYSPTLAGIVAAKSSTGIEAVGNKIIEAISS